MQEVSYVFICLNVAIFSELFYRVFITSYSIWVFCVLFNMLMDVINVDMQDVSYVFKLRSF